MYSKCICYYLEANILAMCTYGTLLGYARWLPMAWWCCKKFAKSRAKYGGPKKSVSRRPLGPGDSITPRAGSHAHGLLTDSLPHARTLTGAFPGTPCALYAALRGTYCATHGPYKFIRPHGPCAKEQRDLAQKGP